jgi:hypothetical protein
MAHDRATGQGRTRLLRFQTVSLIKAVFKQKTLDDGSENRLVILIYYSKILLHSCDLILLKTQMVNTSSVLCNTSHYRLLH